MSSYRFFIYGLSLLFLLSLYACSESSKSGVSPEDSQILEIEVPSDSSDSDNSVASSSSKNDNVSSSEAKSTGTSSETKTSESSSSGKKPDASSSSAKNDSSSSAESFGTSSKNEPETSSSSTDEHDSSSSSDKAGESSSSEELKESSSSVDEQSSSSSESKTEESSSSVVFCAEGSFNPKTQLCDTRDGQVYSMVTINKVTWMKQNLNYSMSGSACYGNSNENCLKHGRLYSTNAAETACPAGWNLPTLNQMLSLGTGYYDNT